MKQKMTADKLFKDLGYDKTSYSNIEGYQKQTDSGLVLIFFDKNYRKLKITYDCWFTQYDNTIAEMNEEEREAIYQRLKELGGIKNETSI